MIYLLDFSTLVKLTNRNILLQYYNSIYHESSMLVWIIKSVIKVILLFVITYLSVLTVFQGRFFNAINYRI